MSTPESEAPTRPGGRDLLTAALLLSATALLYAASQAAMQSSCWVVGIVIAATAYPIWIHQRERTMFARRVVLDGLMRDTSRIRRWLWRGQVSSALQVLVAVLWATLLLTFASLVETAHWVVIAADAVVLALLVRPVTQWVGREALEGKSGLAARRWMLLWGNVTIVAVAFFAVDFFFVGSPDTRGLGWQQVADNAFTGRSAGIGCAAASGLIGSIAAVDALAWHAAEILIPSLQSGVLKWVAWIVFLLQAGVVAVAVTRLHLGLVSLLDRRVVPRDRGAQGVFLAAIAVAFGIAALVSQAMREIDPSSLAQVSRRAVAWANPCRADPDALTVLKTGLDARLQNVRLTQQQQANSRIDAAIDELFAKAELGVEDYLDWYYSMSGEYERLFMLVTGKFAQTMQQELEKRTLGDRFGDRLQQVSGDVATATRTSLASTATALAAETSAGVRSKPCLVDRISLPAIASLDRDVARASAAVTSGTVVAIAAALLARRAATAMVARAAAKQGFQGAAKIAGRTAAKRSGPAMAAAGGAVACGPLCAALLGAATWLIVDAVAIRIDEMITREDLRAELLESLRAQKAELRSQLHALHAAMIDESVLAIQQSVHRVFVPAQQGL